MMQRRTLPARAKALAPLLILSSLGWFASAQAAPIAENVILMIADGSGANTIAATGMYNGNLGAQIFDGADWSKTWVSTYPLRTGATPIPGAAGLAQNPSTVYDPAKNWDTTPVATQTGAFPDRFAGYQWNKTTAPDSANTIVSAVTGQKTYNNAVNVDGNGNALTTFAETMRGAGKSVGVVSTVQFSDATPAVAGGAHNVSRTNRTAITSEMLNSGTLNVIMGTGNPDYDNNGNLRVTPDNSWISASDWNGLKNGTHASGFSLIQDKAQFEALATAATTPDKLIGVARSFDSTQFNRAGANPATETPYSVARKTDVPSLTTMTLGALNILDNDADGMFLMIEGGGVDRAMHGNNLGRMVEEKIEFDDAIKAVSDYLDANTNGKNWANTLVIVTADHDHLLFGPDSDTIPFQDLVNNGAGSLPGYYWQHTSHSNQLIPLYARGPGSDLFSGFADQVDAFTDAQGRSFGRGNYLDQTEIHDVLQAAAVPEPATMAIMAFGASLLLIRRRPQATT